MESSMAPSTVLELIDCLEAVKSAIRKTQATYREVGAEWETNNDIRSQWFDGVFKILTITQALPHLYRSHISNYTWWKTIAPSLSATHMNWIMSETENLYRWTLLHSTYAQMEESLRRITEAYDPAFMSHRQSLSSITTYLCDALGLRRYKKLFRLVALTRNTLHNNGHFRPDFGGPRQQVTWQGTIHRLRLGKSAEYVNWDFTASHIQHLAEAMRAIVTNERIAALPRVRRAT